MTGRRPNGKPDARLSTTLRAASNSDPAIRAALEEHEIFVPHNAYDKDWYWLHCVFSTTYTIGNIRDVCYNGNVSHVHEYVFRVVDTGKYYALRETYTLNPRRCVYEFVTEPYRTEFYGLTERLTDTRFLARSRRIESPEGTTQHE